MQLNTVVGWCMKWKIKINKDKRGILDETVFLEGNQIPYNAEVKYLRVIIDQ